MENRNVNEILKNFFLENLKDVSLFKIPDFKVQEKKKIEENMGKFYLLIDKIIELIKTNTEKYICKHYFNHFIYISDKEQYCVVDLRIPIEELIEYGVNDFYNSTFESKIKEIEQKFNENGLKLSYSNYTGRNIPFVNANNKILIELIVDLDISDKIIVGENNVRLKEEDVNKKIDN